MNNLKLLTLFGTKRLRWL